MVDTMIASAWLGRTVSARRARWADTLGRSGWILPFAVVAEMRFGARVADWGPRRTAALERLVAKTQVSPPLPEVIAAYVEVRTWCVRNGHGLGAKDHEADRWVAATAIAGGLPLATDDGIFDQVVGAQQQWGDDPTFPPVLVDAAEQDKRFVPGGRALDAVGCDQHAPQFAGGLGTVKRDEGVLPRRVDHRTAPAGLIAASPHRSPDTGRAGSRGACRADRPPRTRRGLRPGGRCRRASSPWLRSTATSQSPAVRLRQRTGRECRWRCRGQAEPGRPRPLPSRERHLDARIRDRRGS
ncbi:MAG: type II toxin-antitoxin system VapC family toxin, partial [Actinomycetia bacterium]|nr:type II toxin-antitoxin system VapC family toxin [Actinomycetes bacterium]